MHKCPVCGLASLAEPSHNFSGRGSQDICPSCGVQFGNSDYTTSFEELRQNWESNGMRWWSKAQVPPPGWDPQKLIQTVVLEQQSGIHQEWTIATKRANDRKAKIDGSQENS